MDKENSLTADIVPGSYEGFYPSYESLVSVRDPIILGDTYVSEVNNIQVETDNNDLAQFCDFINIHSHFGSSRAKLRYSTQQNPEDEIRKMFCSPNLERFSITSGVHPGSLISLIWGIEEHLLVETDWVGLHSAAIYDSLKNKTHLLIAKSRLGKTTYGYLLEQANPSRFYFKGDEWNYLNLQNGGVMSGFPFLGLPRNPYIRDDFCNSMRSSEMCQFDSKVYWKNEHFDLDTGNLGSVLLLSDGDSEADLQTLLLKAHKNIPFIGADFSQGASLNDPGYQKVIQNLEIIRNKLFNLPSLRILGIENTPEKYEDNILRILERL